MTTHVGPIEKMKENPGGPLLLELFKNVNGFALPFFHAEGFDKRKRDRFLGRH